MDQLSHPSPRKRIRLVTSIPDELGKLIAHDSRSLDQDHDDNLVALFRHRQDRGDFTDLARIKHHPAYRILKTYGLQGAPVKLSSKPWTTAQNDAAIARGPHKSANEYIEFLRSEMAEMVKAAQWIVLPYSKIRGRPGLRVSPIGVVPQKERRPRTIVDYSYYSLNAETLPLAPMEAMQFGRALERYIRKIVHADPRFGPVKMIKVDLADGFYRVWVNAPDVIKLGVAFPNLAGEEPLIAFPIALPMGWTNSPPCFCAATETIADISNERILKWRNPKPHRLETLAATEPPPAMAILQPPPAPLIPSLPVPPTLDPLLHKARTRVLAAVDIFVDDFLGVAQGDASRLGRIRRILFTAIDDVFRPMDVLDKSARREPISVSKLMKGDACWTTRKKILGWILDTIAMTLTLPESRAARLKELLDDIPPNQKRVSEEKWHKALGELRSMAIALPGASGLFSLLQEAFRHKKQSRIRLSQGVHDALADFRWLQADLTTRPTRLYELVPVEPTLVGSHDASGFGAGGVWFPKPTAVARQTFTTRLTSLPSGEPQVTSSIQDVAAPIVWRARFPPDVVKSLVSFKNPHGTVTNSDLELAGSILHHEAAVQCFDVRERTTKSSTDNTPTLFWQRKGSTTTTTAPAYLLRVQAIHRRFHSYASLHDFLAGDQNSMADDASRLLHLSDLQFLTYFNYHYPQHQSWQMWTPTPSMLSTMITALRRKRSRPESFLLAPAPPIPIGTSGPLSASLSLSTPCSPASSIPLSFSKSSLNAIAPVKLPPAANLCDLEQWKMPYGALAKRSRVWGPSIRG